MSQRSRANIFVHVVWSTRHRLRTLDRGSDGWLHDRIRAEGEKLGCACIAVGNASDHVHLVLKLLQTVSLSAVMQQIKGGSCHAWNQSDPSFADDRNHPLIWQDGYWAESCDPSRIGMLVHYVQHQRELHRDSSPFDAWLTAPRPQKPGFSRA